MLSNEKLSFIHPFKMVSNKSRQWWALVAHEVNSLLGHIIKTAHSRVREMITPFYSPLVSPNLNYRFQFWALQYKKDMAELKGATKQKPPRQQNFPRPGFQVFNLHLSPKSWPILLSFTIWIHLPAGWSCTMMNARSIKSIQRKNKQKERAWAKDLIFDKVIALWRRRAWIFEPSTKPVYAFYRENNTYY